MKYPKNPHHYPYELLGRLNNMSFSQRKGIKPVRKAIQIDDIDSDLRNSLWNALDIHYWQRVHTAYISIAKDVNDLIIRVWLNYFKVPIDTLSDHWSKTRAKIREYFFDCEWNEVYDFIEFIANNHPYSSLNEEFTKLCNSLLERESSAYRFVGGRIAQITSQVEISEIEEALQITGNLKGINTHLKTALELFSDRKAPDYRNSMKESISAVEAICKLITGEESATLGQALKRIENTLGLSPALKSAFSNLYGYTSGEDGIRHALHDESNLGFEDAKFFLVACSAFVNYLVAKASKAGIKL